MQKIFAASAVLAPAAATSMPKATTYAIDDTAGSDGCRVYDGIGGLSGGGATSVLMPHFPKPQRDAVLDYLFKPNYGASLQVLKVEIGGDSDSTDGAEASHMRTPTDEDYNRGYEWFMMKEAKARNPNIKLWGLPWVWPRWIACEDYPHKCDMKEKTPYKYIDNAVTYIVKWVEGAKRVHNLTIDYVGDWNEKDGAFKQSYDYEKALRKGLDAAGLQHTKIAIWDRGAKFWNTTVLFEELEKDPELSAAVYAVGLHYPAGQDVSDKFPTLPQRIWSAEDSSTFNNIPGGGCWARHLNKNFVYGNITSAINWNLVAAYPKGTAWYRSSLMNALQPWNGGAYGIKRADGTWSAGAMIWATAHTTQFTEIESYRYLPTNVGLGSATSSGFGSGELLDGGTYVTLKNFETGDFTIVLEKIGHEMHCQRPNIAMYETLSEHITFNLTGTMLPADGSSVTLYVWKTHFASAYGEETTEFEQQASITVSSANPTIVLPAVGPNDIWTVTTSSKGHKGTPAPGAESAPAGLFPTGPYIDNFDDCPASSEAKYFLDQYGAWECMPDPVAVPGTSHGMVMKQMTPLNPLHRVGGLPFSMIGHRDMTDITIEHDVYFPSEDDTAVIGARFQHDDHATGFGGANTGCLFVLLGSGKFYHTTQKYKTSSSGMQTLKSGAVADGKWHRLQLSITGKHVVVTLDGVQVSEFTYTGSNNMGFGMIGNTDYGQGALIDNFALNGAYTTCSTSPDDIAVGTKVNAVECVSEVANDEDNALNAKRQWIFATNGTTAEALKIPYVIQFKANPNLCMAPAKSSSSASSQARSSSHLFSYDVELVTCDRTSDAQLFTYHYAGAEDDANEDQSYFVHKGTGGRLHFRYNGPVNSIAVDVGSVMQITNSGKEQKLANVMHYDIETQEIASEVAVVCAGIC